MKKLSTLLLLTILFSCSSKKKTPPVKESQMKILASVTLPDGTRQMEVVMRAVGFRIDSSMNVKADTQFFLIRDIQVPKVDSTGKRDTVIETKYFRYNKDSINTKIQEVNYDSLTYFPKPKK